jgi:hypothetical protein
MSKKVLAAFPAVTNAFVDILIERAIANGFTNNRLTDAVNNVIETCHYPTPRLADFLTFDRRVRVYSYNQVCDMVTRNEAKFDDFAIIKIKGEPYRIRKSDKNIYNILDEY